MALTTTLDRTPSISDSIAAGVDIAATLAHLDLGITVCHWCAAELVHCHDTLIAHAIGELHCGGNDCDTATELHHLVVSCAEMSCDCASTA
jgi:hypothetical protein